MITTVNMNCFTLKYLGETWKYVHPKFHVHLFNVDNCCRLLNSIGFDIIRLRTTGVRTSVGGKRKWLSRVLRPIAKLKKKGHRLELMAVKRIEHSSN